MERFVQEWRLMEARRTADMRSPDSLNLFSSVISWKPSGTRPLSFVYDNVLFVSFAETEEGLNGEVSLRFDEVGTSVERLSAWD